MIHAILPGTGTTSVRSTTALAAAASASQAALARLVRGDANATAAPSISQSQGSMMNRLSP